MIMSPQGPDSPLHTGIYTVATMRRRLSSQYVLQGWINKDGFTLDHRPDVTSEASRNRTAGTFSGLFFFFLATTHFSSQLIYTRSSEMLAVDTKRGFVWAMVQCVGSCPRGTHSGAGLMGGRFRCLKYWVTCWGSSARTDFARVSLGAWERKTANWRLEKVNVQVVPSAGPSGGTIVRSSFSLVSESLCQVSI